jgi:hypothetical protein
MSDTLETVRLRAEPATQGLPALDMNATDREKAHWCGVGPYASFSEGAKATIFCRERQLTLALELLREIQPILLKNQLRICATQGECKWEHGPLYKSLVSIQKRLSESGLLEAGK